MVVVLTQKASLVPTPVGVGLGTLTVVDGVDVVDGAEAAEDADGAAVVRLVEAHPPIVCEMVTVEVLVIDAYKTESIPLIQDCRDRR